MVEYIDDSDSPSMTLREAQTMVDWFRHYRTEKSHVAYPYIKNSLKQWKIPVPVLKYKRGAYLYRCRKHYENDPEFFKNITDISYRHDLFNIKDFGRANEPVQSIFYCSDNRNTAIKETSAFYRTGASCEEVITVGKWEVQKDFNIGNLVVNKFDNGIHKVNPVIVNLYNLFNEDMKQYSDEEVEIYKTFLHFFAEEFLVRMPNNAQYLTTTAFANYVYSEFDKELSALVYPSAINSWEGMNFAIQPELLDEDNILKLVDVHKIKLINGSVTNEIHCRGINNVTRNIEWKY